MKVFYNHSATVSFNRNLTFDFCKKNARKIKVYFYLSDFLSPTWVTDMSGNPVQYLYLDAWGSQILSQKISGNTFENEFRFLGMVYDSESGLSLLTNRYYDSGRGIFYSSDKLSEKRAWCSSYNYGQNNPTNRSDPSGLLDDVIIKGKAAGEATAQLQKCAPNLGITRRDSDGKLEYTGTAKTRQEKQIAKAIDDKRVTVNITAENSDSFTHNGDNIKHNEYGIGAFLGNKLTGSNSVNTYQQVNPANAAFYDNATNSNGLMGHEVLESYFGGLNSLKSGDPATPAISNVSNPAYEKAHKQANRYFLGGLQKVIEHVPMSVGGIQLPFPQFSTTKTSLIKTK